MQVPADVSTCAYGARLLVRDGYCRRLTALPTGGELESAHPCDHELENPGGPAGGRHGRGNPEPYRGEPDGRSEDDVKLSKAGLGVPAGALQPPLKGAFRGAKRVARRRIMLAGRAFVKAPEGAPDSWRLHQLPFQ